MSFARLLRTKSRRHVHGPWLHNCQMAELGMVLIVLVAAVAAVVAWAAPFVFTAVLARWVLGGVAKAAIREKAKIDAQQPAVEPPLLRVEVRLRANTDVQPIRVV